MFGGKPARSPLILEEDASQGASAEEEQQEAIVDAATPPSDESPQRRSLRPAPAKQKYKKGKRKGKKILDEEFKALPDRVLGTPTPVEHARNDELLSSNGEEVELDDGREVPGQDNVVKTEEGGEWLPSTRRTYLDRSADS